MLLNWERRCVTPLKIIFCASLSMLCFEVGLLRIFAVCFSYHYAALVLSISMAGVVLGGIYATFKGRAPFEVGRWGLALALSYPAILLLSRMLPADYYRLMWETRQVFFVGFFIVCLAFPFLLYGVILARSLSSWIAVAGRIYATDLLGAGTGVILIMLLLDLMRPEYALLIVAMPLMLVSLLEVRRRWAWATGAAAAVLVVLLIGKGFLTIELSPFKGLMQALKEEGSKLLSTTDSSHGRLDLFENPRMKSAPGLSLAYSGPIPKGQGVSLDGDILGVLLDETAISSYGFLRFIPVALPYSIASPKTVMMIGGTGGFESLVPHYFGAPSVLKAAKNLTMVKFLERHYPPQSLYRKGLIHTSGWLLAEQAGYPVDLITLSFGGFFPAGNFGLQEEYDTTVEALTLYLSRLSPHGCLFVQTFLLPPPRYELRTMNNIVHALQRAGTTAVEEHLVVFRSWDTMNFLVKRSAFSHAERDGIEKFLKEREYELLYPRLPDKEARFIAGLDYTAFLDSLAEPRSGELFAASYPFDIVVTTDDRPFFHYFLKLGRIGEIYELAGSKWTYFLYEGMALPFILLLLIFFSIVLLCGAVLGSPDRLSPGGFCYFLCIGLAFMLVEVFFLHQFIRPRLDAVSAFSLVVATMLLSSGVGSFLSTFVRGKVLLLMGAAPVLLLGYFFFWERILDSALYPISVVPVGLILGFFFPVGLKAFCARAKRSVPLAYAVNGAASVVAPPASSMLAVQYGCGLLLVLACVLYIAALLLLSLSDKGYKGNTT
jgi:hypothetical protein